MTASEKLFKSIFENSPIGLVLVNKDITLRKVNNYMFSTFHLKPYSVMGNRFGNVFHCSATAENGKMCGETVQCQNCPLRKSVLAVMHDGIQIQDMVMNQNFIIDGIEYKKWFRTSASRIQTADDTLAVVSFVDITTQKEYEELLNSRLTLDLATGTLNKYSLLNTLKNLSIGKNNLTIVMIDFDHFKHINDRYGHIIGDKVLNIFSNVALNISRKHDIVGRFGGEEFLFIFKGINSETNIAFLKKIYQTFQDACFEQTNLKPTFSVGMCEITVKRLSEISVDEMIAEADKNLYLAKKNGRNRIVLNGKSIPFD